MNKSYLNRTVFTFAVVGFAISGFFTRQTDPQVSTTSIYEFGNTATFTIIVSEDLSPAGATLLLEIEGLGNTIVEEVVLNSTNGFSNRAVLDLQRSPIPPFSTIRYRWLIDAEDGSTVETEYETFIYADNRFDWQSIANNSAEVLWVDGSREFGQFALDSASRAIEAVQQDLAITSIQPVRIYIYPSEQDLVAGLMLGGETLIAGHAISNLGVALVHASPAPEDQSIVERRIAHETAHLILFQAAVNGYSNLPAWLNEGFATTQEQTKSIEQSQALTSAYEQANFLSLVALCQTLPFTGRNLILAYAESASIVSYIVDQFGLQSLRSLVAAYEEGASCEGGVQRVLGLSLEDLQNQWYSATFVGNDADSSTEAGSAGPWFLLLIPIFLLIVFSMLPIVKRRRELDQPPGSP